MSTPEPAPNTDPSTVAPASPGPTPIPTTGRPPARRRVEINGRQVARVLLGIVLATAGRPRRGLHHHRHPPQPADRPAPQPGRPGHLHGHVLPRPARGEREQRGRLLVPRHLRARRPPLQRAPARHRAPPAGHAWSVAMAVPCDPTLVSPVSVVDTEHASASVFILPAVLLVVLVAMLVVLALRRRRTQAGIEPRSSDGPRRIRSDPQAVGCSGGRRVALVPARAAGRWRAGAVALGRAGAAPPPA